MSQYANKRCLVAVGSNIAGAWGSPLHTIRCALRTLLRRGFHDIVVSHVYATRPSGQIRQPAFVNMAFAARCDHSPRKIIKLFKEVERNAGHRLGARNGPRPLDLDLLDFGGRRVNWPASGRRPALVLPHPLIAERPFVLIPLGDVAPEWRHPATGQTLMQLLARHGGVNNILLRRDICKLDLASFTCDLVDSV